MPQRPEFQQIQYRFAAHIRHPEQNPPPEDVEARRMRIYSELFYNNIEDFMSGHFPVLRSLLDEQQWHALLRDYFSRHRARTPLFPEMAREFLHYLEHEREPVEGDHPFMLELAHYEWVEAVLYLADEEAAVQDLHTDGDLLHGLPVLSSLAWLLSYSYPVHRIGADFLPEQAPQQATHLLVYRDPEDEVQFMELNPVTMKLLQEIRSGQSASSQEILEALAAELQHPQPQQVLQFGLQLLEELRQRQVILGTRP